MTDPNESAPAAGTARGAGGRTGKGGRIDSNAPRRPSRDFDWLNGLAWQAVERIAPAVAPGGRWEGDEYVAINPSRPDKNRGSFRINRRKREWNEFSGGRNRGERAGSVISYAGHALSLSANDAYDWVRDFLGVIEPGSALAAERRSEPKRQEPATSAALDSAEAVVPVPADAPPHPLAHPRLGRPAASWWYHDATGSRLFCVCRFDTGEGNKQVLPVSLWREGSALRWQWKGLPAPRPLYGLDRLAGHPAATLLVVEGEKAADAAGRLLPEAVVLTSPNGSRSAGAADWSPVKGRRLLVWPDADGPGAEYAADVGRMAAKAGAASVAVLKLDRLAALRGAAPTAGWDAADAEAEGLDLAALAAVLADPAAWEPLQPSPPPKTDSKPPPRSAGRGDAGGRFFVVDKPGSAGRRPGVYWQPAAVRGGDGEMIEPPPLWLCTPLRVSFRTRDADGASWGRLLEWTDAEGTARAWSCPAAMFQRGGDELREELASGGVEIATDANTRRHLLRYLAESNPPEFARCATRCGWHGAQYLTAAGTLGEGSERLIYQHVGGEAAKWTQAGSLEGWRDLVCAPLAGNSRPVLAVSAAFAAVCLGLIEGESGGLHWRGPSSCGKTTLLRLAAAVFGHPVEYVKSWRSTSNSLESIAAAHSDAALLLDEIAELEAREAAAAGYMLGNACGKSRATRTGGLRPAARWRVLFQSSGEVALASLVAESGGRSRAGHEVRLLDLPAEAGAGLGIFERLPADTAPGVFADALRAAALAHHGHAAPAFIARLVADLDRARRFLRAAVDRLGNELAGGDAAGQVRRVAQRLALIAAAGELAGAYGLTGWGEGEAERAARRCFNDWLSARGGSGEAEPREMLRQVQHFLSLHGDGRFAPFDRADDDRAPKTLQRAGWRVDTPEGVEFWALPEIWKREICSGFDSGAVARVLIDRGLIKPESGGGLTRAERIKGQGRVRVVRLLPGILEHIP